MLREKKRAMDKMKILELEHVQKMTAVNVRVSIPLQIEIEKKNIYSY